MLLTSEYHLNTLSVCIHEGVCVCVLPGCSVGSNGLDGVPGIIGSYTTVTIKYYHRKKYNIKTICMTNRS